jgi:hypothetical protein
MVGSRHADVVGGGAEGDALALGLGAGVGDAPGLGAVVDGGPSEPGGAEADSGGTEGWGCSTKGGVSPVGSPPQPPSSRAAQAASVCSRRILGR